MLGWSISPVPSWALGTISERNLRSSVDSARELDAEDLFDLEKRPKKRETAEGARTGTSASDDRVEASILEMVENSARADIVADRVASVDGEMIVLGTTGIELSTSVLARETVLARGEITTGEVGRIEGEEPERALDAVFRPKKIGSHQESSWYRSWIVVALDSPVKRYASRRGPHLLQVHRTLTSQMLPMTGTLCYSCTWPEGCRE